MKRFTILLTAAAFILSAGPVWASTEPKDDRKADGLKIVVTSLDITDKALNMTYDIRNESEDDVWIYTGSLQSMRTTFGMGAGVHWAEDDQTLTIDARLQKPDYRVLADISFGRFVRLRSGKIQTESIFIEIPIHLSPRSENIKRQGQAARLTIELSYYSEDDLPKKILERLEEQERSRPIDSRGPILPHFFFGQNECLMSRDDELLNMGGGVDPIIAREKVLKSTIDNVRIPYQEVPMHRVTYERPDLKS